MTGQCRDCMRRRLVQSCGRSGGGNYRRGNRSYRSSICAECAIGLLDRWTPGTMTTSRWDNFGLATALERHAADKDQPEAVRASARAAVARHESRRQTHRRDQERRLLRCAAHVGPDPEQEWLDCQACEDVLASTSMMGRG